MKIINIALNQEGSCVCPGYLFLYFRPVTIVELPGKAVTPLNLVSVSEKQNF